MEQLILEWQCQYGQPHQLAQSEIGALLNSPDVKIGDAKAFQSFTLNVGGHVDVPWRATGARAYLFRTCWQVTQ